MSDGRGRTIPCQYFESFTADALGQDRLAKHVGGYLQGQLCKAKREPPESVQQYTEMADDKTWYENGVEGDSFFQMFCKGILEQTNLETTWRKKNWDIVQKTN